MPRVPARTRGNERPRADEAETRMEARVPLGPPRPQELVSCVGAARPTWRKQSGCQQLASSDAAGEVDRVGGEPVDEESAATRQRAVDEAVRAINWLHGVDCRPWLVHSSNEPAYRRTSELHLEAQQHVEEAVLRWPSAVCASDDSASLREMLKGRGGYSPSASQTNLAPYEYPQVSVRDSPFLEEILDVEDSGFRRGYETQMLRTPKALAEFLSECGEISCHTDPVLKTHVRACSKFVRKMRGVGLVDCSLPVECELGVFFVHKKSGKRANARFRAPPSTGASRTSSSMRQDAERQTSSSYVSTWK